MPAIAAVVDEVLTVSEAVAGGAVVDIPITWGDIGPIHVGCFTIDTSNQLASSGATVTVLAGEPDGGIVDGGLADGDAGDAVYDGSAGGTGGSGGADASVDSGPDVTDAAATDSGLCKGAPPGWSNTSTMSMARSGHVSAVLPSGRVLVIGGGSPGNSAESFSPSTAAWSAAASTEVSVGSRAAARLLDGRLLLAGGAYTWSTSDATELYSEPSNTWVKLQTDPSGAHARGLLSVLTDGKVLLTGGNTCAYSCPSAIASLFHPGSDTWTSVGNLQIGRHMHTATPLPANKLLIAGGQRCKASDCKCSMGYYLYSDTEIFDGNSATWSSGPPMTIPRYNHAAVLLADGRVLVVGGYTGDGTCSGSGHATATTEIYDPVTNQWSPGPALSIARAEHRAVVLPSGKVLISGGVEGGGGALSSSSELFDPAMESWSPAGGMAEARRGHTMEVLVDGAVLVSGGTNTNGNLATAERFCE